MIKFGRIEPNKICGGNRELAVKEVLRIKMKFTKELCSHVYLLKPKD